MLINKIEKENYSFYEWLILYKLISMDEYNKLNDKQYIMLKNEYINYKNENLNK